VEAVMQIEDRKIIGLRKDRKISQAKLANAMFISPGKISRVERGKGQFTPEERKLAAAFFGVEGALMSEQELIAADVSISDMRIHTIFREFDKAGAIRDRLAKMVDLEPCNSERSMLFRLNEAHYLLSSDNIDEGEEKMDFLHGLLDSMNYRNQYFYYFNMGILHIKRTRHEEGLKACIKALYLIDKIDNHDGFQLHKSEKQRLHCNIGSCCIYLQYINHAVLYLTKIRGLDDYNEERRTILDFHVDVMLAQSYIKSDALYEAKRLLDRCHVWALGDEDNTYIGWVEFCYGALYMGAKDWDKALPHLNKAIECSKEGTELHFSALKHKVKCLTDSRTFPEAGDELDEAIAIYGTHDVYSTYFVSLGHCLTISRRMSCSNPEEVEYLEKVAIPYFEEKHDYLDVKDCYELMEAHLEKIGNGRESYRMGQEARDIYKRCFASNIGGIQL